MSTMKKTMLLLFILIILLVSCKSEFEKKLEGKWILVGSDCVEAGYCNNNKVRKEEYIIFDEDNIFITADEKAEYKIMNKNKVKIIDEGSIEQYRMKIFKIKDGKMLVKISSGSALLNSIEKWRKISN